MPTEPIVSPNPVPVTPVVKKRDLRKFIRPLTIGGTVLVLALGWLTWNHFHTPDSGTSGMVTGKVKRGDLIETVTATGSIAAQTGAQVKIGSQISGRIKRLYADVGTVVKAGDLIAELDLPDIVAELAGAKANYAAAQAKLKQQETNVTLGSTQTRSDVRLSQANFNSARDRLSAAQASFNLQQVQTPSDIRKATAALTQAQASLTTAQSVLLQVQAGANLQIENGDEAVAQAVATNVNNQADLERQNSLSAKGYVAGKIVEQAKQTATVSASLVRSTQKNLDLIKQKVAADLQTAKDQVTQMQQGVLTSQASLQAAQAEEFTSVARQADVRDAASTIVGARASVDLSLGNLALNQVHALDVVQAQNALKDSASLVAVSQAQVDKTNIRSPISGTVLQLASQQGETLAAGLSAPTLIIVADLKRLEVDAYVDETDIGKVKIGQPVSITVDAFPNQTMTGKVAKIASGSTIQQSVVTYGVTIFIDDTQNELKPDMTANVTIETGRLTNVLVVPSVAVQVTVDGSTVNVLKTVKGTSVSSATPVTTGGTDGVNIEITKGLKEGDVIVLAGAKTTKAKAATSAFGGSGGGGGGRPGG